MWVGLIVVRGRRRKMARKETVTRVIDGDTFETGSRNNPVRLANVDTPEKGTPGAAKAREALARLVLGKEVRIDTKARDVYGRAVANVKVGVNSVNKAMKRYEK
jgi:endonuclease YncB( thermonuclease family)